MKRSPLKSYTPLKRKKPLNKVSKKGKLQNAILRRSSLIVRERSGGRCEAPADVNLAVWALKKKVNPLWISVTLADRCNNPVTIPPHHIKPRSKGRDDSPENLLDLCFDCHNWVTNHPIEARALGVLK